MNFEGIILGFGAFLMIGMFHPLVIKGEYYWGVRCWPVFFLIGVLGCVGSLLIDNTYISVMLGVFGFSCFWSILELFEQRERVRKGWFPKNPNRKALGLALLCTMMLGVSCAKPAQQSQSATPVVCGGCTDYRALTDADEALFAKVYDVEPALTPYQVATQVVAGTNYRFLCRDAAGEEYTVTIFVPLPCNGGECRMSVSKNE